MSEHISIQHFKQRKVGLDERNRFGGRHGSSSLSAYAGDLKAVAASLRQAYDLIPLVRADVGWNSRNIDYLYPKRFE